MDKIVVVAIIILIAIIIITIIICRKNLEIKINHLSTWKIIIQVTLELRALNKIVPLFFNRIIKII
jgi:hypothetical protein